MVALRAIARRASPKVELVSTQPKVELVSTQINRVESLTIESSRAILGGRSNVKLYDKLSPSQQAALNRVSNALAAAGKLETEQQEKAFLERCQRRDTFGVRSTDDPGQVS